MQEWVQTQKYSGHHRAAVILFPIILFLGYFHPAISGVGMIVFFLVTSFKLLKTMLLYMLILGALSALIPPLAPIILIIMIVLFIMRINYVVKNWRPFVAGILIYGGAGIVIYRVSLDPYHWMSYNFTLSTLLESFIVSLIAFFALRATLIGLYKQKYNSSTALGIMGSAPLIIISFILPFLKMHIGGDFFGHDAAFTDGHTIAGGNHTFHNGHTDPVLNSDTSIANGTHLQHVKAHLRTAPDGDPTNNLSYHGPDAKPVNTTNLVQVHDYIRTTPDGDLTNNLSYQGLKSNNLHNPVPVQSADSTSTDNILPDVQIPVIIFKDVGQNAVDQLIQRIKEKGE